jgi:hypothetical protein
MVEDVANNDTGGGQQSGGAMTNKKQQPTIDGSSAMMEDDGAGSRHQERAEGTGVDEGGQTTTDQQSAIDVSGKGGWGYSCESKGCAGSEWGILPLRGPWRQRKSW